MAEDAAGWPADAAAPDAWDTRPPPPDLGIAHLAIVGAGLIGGSVALAAKRAWPGICVTAIDRGAALDAARLVRAFDRASDALESAAGADLVVLAAPVRQNIEILGLLPRVLDRPALVTDAGSTKREMVTSAAALPDHLSFVGGHPLAGAARGGLALARADLFSGRPWLVTPSPATRSIDDVRRIERFVQALGAIPRVIDAGAHDRLLAFLSHLPQLTASALMQTVGDAAGDHIALAGPGLIDTTRLASSPADIWQDICATNADAIRLAIDALVDAMRALRDGLDDPSAVARTFDAAQRWRERLIRPERRRTPRDSSP